MLSHITIGTNDFPRAMAFWEPLMEDILGLPVRRKEEAVPWKLWATPGGPAGGRPFLAVMGPFDGRAHDAGNGQMVALMVERRAIVDAAHAYAIANGGADEGAPSLRPQYHPHYYGAYFRDPDGNKICIVCHEPEDN